MCGIAGGLAIGDSLPDLSRIVDMMTRSLVHRGPDDSGSASLSTGDSSLRIALGHRRLSIIDLSSRARQPMATPDGRLAIVYNGEIYNFVELREDLVRLGHHFETTSDTEVVLHAYDAWGTECFARFNGMWAMAIADLPRRRIVFSRDRFGKKPLYLARTADGLFFASEIKALLTVPGMPRRPNLEKAFRYLSTNYRYVDIDEDSFFQEIRQVPRSTFAITGEDLSLRTTRYFDVSAGESAGLSDAQAVERFRDLFTDAVRIRLRSDVPLACMLSGGLDSTSITCVAYRVLGTPIKTFSGVTGEEKGIYDESEYIDSVVRHTGANHEYVRPDPSDLFQTVDQMLSFHDEPVCTVTWYGLYLLAKKIRERRIPVVLNGHGGDEVTAGYWDYYHYHFHDLEAEGRSAEAIAERESWRHNHGRDSAEIDRYRAKIADVAAGRASEMSRFPDYSDCFAPEARVRWKREIVLKNPMRGMLARRLYSDLVYETIPPSLRAEDRNTMSQSIESRSPFLDYRLVDLCASLPGSMKIRGGLGKWILREAMKGILPEDVRTRKDKSGFLAPADVWFRTTNRDELLDLVASRACQERGIYDLRRLRAIVDEHLGGQRNHAMFLWQFVNLELWFARFFGRETPADTVVPLIQHHFCQPSLLAPAPAPVSIVPDPWLSTQLRVEAHRLSFDPSLSDTSAGALAQDRALLDAIARPGFIDAKVPVDAPWAARAIRCLEVQDFTLVDTNVVLQRSLIERARGPEMAGARTAASGKVRPATGADRDAVVALAGRSFRYSRFHLDPRIAPETANRIKAQWVAGYFEGRRGDGMVVIDTDAQVAGFLLYFDRPESAGRTLTIDLIAVAPEHQRRGLASALIRGLESMILGASRIVVGTQLANVPSIRCYENLGFRLAGSSYVFHRHSLARGA